MIKWDDFNYSRFKLIKVKNVFNMVKSHEQGVLTRFLILYSLELMLVLMFHMQLLKRTELSMLHFTGTIL
jgi:hypothetical protein